MGNSQLRLRGKWRATPEVWESIYQIYSTGGKEDAFNLNIDELEANFAEVNRSPLTEDGSKGPPLEVNWLVKEVTSHL